MTIPYSTALYNQAGGFGTGYVPTFGVIGKDNVVYYNDAGYDEQKLMKAVNDAILSLADVSVVNPIGSFNLHFGESIDIDIATVFESEGGHEIAYELVGADNPEILSGEINGSTLTLTAGYSEVVVDLTLKGITEQSTASNKFKVYITPGNVSYILIEGFEGSSELPEGWTTIDEDGDSRNWFIGTPMDETFAHSGTNCATSASYDQISLHPDNWLVTPQLTLSGENVISYWVCSQNAAYPQEHYGVYISDTGTGIADFELLFEETLTAKNTNSKKTGLREPGEYYERNITIPEEYKKKAVYFAFRHFDCSDKFRINLDDIKVQSVNAITENGELTAKTVELLGNYPNPFNPNTTISFKLNDAAKVKLTVFNVRGELVEELLNNKLNAGIHNLNFNAAKLNSGVYYYRLEAGESKITKKMLLIK